tara:strand:- start:435 stop:959 length:525 start_codon:yes stop_codon:yes gene_type:complete
MKLTPNMNVLYDFFPGGNYIMIVRDPRDIISSMLRVGKKQKDENIESHFPYNLSLLCNKINISYRLYLEPKFEDFVSKKIHTIKYEDFVTDPLKQLNIFSVKFFNKKLYKNTENIWERSKDVYASNNKKAYQSELWGHNITTKKINEYKNTLRDNEINEISKYCKKYMNYFSYS